METFIWFKKKYFKHSLKNHGIYIAIPIELFVDMKIFQNFVKFGDKIMLEIFVLLNVYL
jgi:hypothetical protein